MAELPSGTVTFLFTDVEGSTRLWEDHPEAMRPALARHDEIVGHAITAHDGHVVKTTGDGFHAAFRTAQDAIGAAVDAQAALRAEVWSETGPLLVRIGVHTGETQERDGDYYGTAVNRAARVMAVAHGGQIVVLAGDGRGRRARRSRCGVSVSTDSVTWVRPRSCSRWGADWGRVPAVAVGRCAAGQPAASGDDVRRARGRASRRWRSWCGSHRW